MTTEDRKQRYYGLMARETARLHRLVEDLLDFGRIDAGVRQYDFRPTDLSALVHQTVLEFQEEHASSGVRVEVEQAPTPPVLADVEALRRALHNLLDNALKYSPGQDEILVSVHAGETHVSISVEDYGMGIAPDDLRRIFGKFERGAAAKASSIRGTGLGLAMVQAIMTAHGGSVSVDSELHRGSTFTLILPGGATAQQRVVWHAS